MEIGDATTGDILEALLYASDDEDLSGGSAVMSIASNFTSGSSSGVSANGSIDEIDSDVDQNFTALNNIALLYATDDENFSGGSAVPSIAFDSSSESSSGVSANGSIDEIDSDVDQNFAALNSIALVYGTDDNFFSAGSAVPTIAFNSTSESSSGVSANGSIDEIDSDVDQTFAALNTIAILNATDGSSEDGDQNFASLNTIAVLYRSSSDSSGSDTIGALSDISPESDDIGIQHDMIFEQTWERGSYLS
ncbi:hypothetical protein AQUCO_02000197v1 [Aquilegia coerulea]|uniref:Uncharacterized protein n=1 Tax=Aquilegia coerulea TaxID=218851 RepID=A0A2G5DGD4_AQUCA|nr:hypothetical protein AQUCO_02000197v1 [Aquilegia coerulea]